MAERTALPLKGYGKQEARNQRDRRQTPNCDEGAGGGSFAFLPETVAEFPAPGLGSVPIPIGGHSKLDHFFGKLQFLVRQAVGRLLTPFTKKSPTKEGPWFGIRLPFRTPFWRPCRR